MTIRQSVYKWRASVEITLTSSIVSFSKHFNNNHGEKQKFHMNHSFNILMVEIKHLGKNLTVVIKHIHIYGNGN